MTAQNIVVAYHSFERSMAALEWAINRCKIEDTKLTVVHVASTPITVHNGPSRAVAKAMGDPEWATVHSVVQGLNAPPDTLTVIDHGDPVHAILKHLDNDSLVVLGRRCTSRWSRRSVERRLRALLLAVPIIRIDERFTKTPDPRSPIHEDTESVTHEANPTRTNPANGKELV